MKLKVSFRMREEENKKKNGRMDMERVGKWKRFKVKPKIDRDVLDQHVPWYTKPALH